MVVLLSINPTVVQTIFTPHMSTAHLRKNDVRAPRPILVNPASWKLFSILAKQVKLARSGYFVWQHVIRYSSCYSTTFCSIAMYYYIMELFVLKS